MGILSEIGYSLEQRKRKKAFEHILRSAQRERIQVLNFSGPLGDWFDYDGIPKRRGVNSVIGNEFSCDRAVIGVNWNPFKRHPAVEKLLSIRNKSRTFLEFFVQPFAWDYSGSGNRYIPGTFTFSLDMFVPMANVPDGFIDKPIAYARNPDFDSLDALFNRERGKLVEELKEQGWKRKYDETVACLQEQLQQMNDERKGFPICGGCRGEGGHSENTSLTTDDSPTYPGEGLYFYVCKVCDGKGRLSPSGGSLVEYIRAAGELEEQLQYLTGPGVNHMLDRNLSLIGAIHLQEGEIRDPVARFVDKNVDVTWMLQERGIRNPVEPAQVYVKLEEKTPRFFFFGSFSSLFYR